ncbi:MAG TPA: glycosyltransferase family 39 protein [Anaerolineae bacterium]|nr:glycosyltransferase family 39 protein [Anaerolineae bacterium]
MSDNHASPTTPRFFGLLVLTILVASALRLIEVGTTPPGLHYDEAADTIIAEQIARGDSAPIFVEAYTGKEVLFFNWAAAWMKLIGPSVFAMRLAAAMLGILTVALTYRVVKEMLSPPLALSGRGAGGEGVALLATIFIATSFAHILMSRLGFRSIAEPFIQSIALAALFRGLRLNRLKWIVIAGVFVGLNLYTYLAARLFPVAVGVLFLYMIIADRGQRRQRMIQFLVLTLCAIIIFLPLGIYFINNPAAFITRIQQVAPRADQPIALLDNIGRALGMVFVSGDPYIRFNEPYRPLFPFLLGILYSVGLIVALIGLFRSRAARRRFAYFAITSITLIMLLPTALAVNEITPSNLRAIGLLPIVFVFPALGAWWLLKKINSVISSRATARNLSLTEVEIPRFARNDKLFSRLNPRSIILSILVATTIDASVTYFGQYVHEPQLYIQSDGDLTDISALLNHTDTSHDQVYIAALHYRHPTAAALANDYNTFKWLTGNQIVVIPDESAYLFFARLALPDQAWLDRFLPPSMLIDAPLAPDGQTNYREYHLSAQPTIKPQAEMKVNYGNIIQLMGYDREAHAESGRTASVTLYWRVLNKPDRGDYSTFIQLNDQWGFEWGQNGSFDYPSEEWEPGEVIINRIDVPVAAGAPPGDYELRVGLFSQSTNQRINIVANDGSFGGTIARLSPIEIERASKPSSVSDLGIGINVEREITAGLKLLGYSRGAQSIHQNEKFFMTLFWQSESMLNDAAISIQLKGDSTTITLTTTLPVHGLYPFSQWLPNEIVADQYALRVPIDAPPGQYTLEVSIGAGSSIGLGTIEIVQANRIMVEPEIDHRMNVMLGDAIELVGYNLDQSHLTLIWRSIKSLDQDYTVFTHVLDQSGQQIAGQDNQPLNGSYPTSRWSAGEYVIDPYAINVASGQYAIEVGLYDPETGAHLGQMIQLK